MADEDSQNGTLLGRIVAVVDVVAVVVVVVVVVCIDWSFLLNIVVVSIYCKS